MGAVSQKSPINIKAAVTKGTAERVGGTIIFAEAYGIWSVKDIFGTGAAVVEIYSSSASPNTRDFTATELTDGTFAAWVVGDPTVRTFYDQKGSNDLFQGFFALAPKYNASDNSLLFDKSGYFGNYRQLTSSVTSGIGFAFSGNDAGDGVTFSMVTKDNDGSKGTGLQAAFGVIGSAPASAISQVTKMITKNETSLAPGLRVKDDSPTFTTVTKEHDTAFSSSSFENMIGIIQRLPTPGVTATGFNLFRDGTEVIDESDTTISSNITISKFFLGNSRFNTQTCIAFDKALSDNEIAELNTELNNL